MAIFSRQLSGATSNFYRFHQPRDNLFAQQTNLKRSFNIEKWFRVKTRWHRPVRGGLEKSIGSASSFNYRRGRRKVEKATYRLLVSWKPPSSRRIFANSTAFRNGTSIISSRFSSTSNLYFFFFIIKAMPGALGPSNVINKFKMTP